MAEYLQAERKQEIFAKYGKSNTDTGSPESQVALFSYRINHLTEHVKKNKKDVVTRRSLLRLVGKRRQLLDYLQRVDIERYRSIVKELVSVDNTIGNEKTGSWWEPVFFSILPFVALTTFLKLPDTGCSALLTREY